MSWCRSFVLVALASCSSAPEPPSSNTDAASVDTGSTTDAASATCANKSPQPSDATWNVAGRDVRVHVPTTYDPTTASAIVLDLHGLSSDGPDQARIAKMIPASDAHGFIAVHPDGTGSPRGWNAGDCCNPAASSGVDDVAFISTVIDELSAKLCVHPDRVYAIGLSNGGYLAHRLGCELSERIAAIGAVSGVIGIDSCSPSRPVPVFHVHGTDDFVVPYGGGGFNGSIGAEQTIAEWAARNHCTATPETSYDHGDATCVTHSGCDAGADVVLCTIDGGGHQWPGGESTGLLNGKLSDDLDATAAAWEFFAAHPRPVE